MKLALKIPPPVVALTFGLLMWLVDKQVPGGQLEFGMQLPAAIVFAIAGAALVVTSMLAFRKASTTIDPFRPDETSHLVVDGVFRYSRNPMYVSLALVLIGWAVWLGSVLNLVVLALFISYMTVIQIKPEEKALRSLFGEPYEKYCTNVRRWI